MGTEQNTQTLSICNPPLTSSGLTTPDATFVPPDATFVPNVSTKCASTIILVLASWARAD